MAMSVSNYATVESANQQNTTVCFDYNGVSPSVAKYLKGQVERIRRSASKSIVEIGKDLIGAKHYLSHGAFLRWVESEVGLPARTAQAYMQVAQWVSQKGVGVATLPPTLLYLLSAPSTPEEFIASVLKRVGAGEQITFQSVRRELKALREAKWDPKHNDACAEFQPAALNAQVMPLKRDVADIVTEAVGILARGLSKVEFKRVRDMMTSKPVLDDPELAQKIVVAFKTIQEATELDRKLQSQNGSGHWTSRESNEASDAVDVTPMELRRSASRSRIASSA
jgi:Protein of unknown function (DUF3102)